MLASVRSVMALGTVIALELETSSSGYASDGAVAAVTRLRRAGVYCRPLGNVVYLMVTPLTSQETCDELLDVLETTLQEQYDLG